MTRMTKNDRLVTLLGEYQPTLLEQLQQIDRDRRAPKAKPRRKPKLISKREAAEMTRKWKSLVKGEVFEIPYHGLTIKLRGSVDCFDGAAVELVGITPPKVSQARQIDVNRIAGTLDNLLAGLQHVDDLVGGIIEAAETSKPFGSYRSRLDAFWDEAYALGEKYDNFNPDELFHP